MKNYREAASVLIKRPLTFLFLNSSAFIPARLRRMALNNAVMMAWRRWLMRQIQADSGVIAELGEPLYGYRMRINPSFQKSLITGTWEPETCRTILQNVRPGQVCVDAGANIGYASLLMAKQVGDSGRVIAFEPLVQNFNVLRENVSLNRCPQIVCECLGLSNSKGMAVLTYRDEAMTCGGSLVTKTPYGFSPEIKEASIETATLDGYVSDHRLPPIDFVKIDVEGAEGLVLEGMLQIIRQRRPTILLEDHHWQGSTVALAHQILSEEGYLLQPIDETHWLAMNSG